MLPFACAQPVHKRRQDSERNERGRVIVDDGAALYLWVLVSAALHRRYPGKALQQGVETRMIAQWSLFSVSRERAVDEIGSNASKCLVVDAKPSRDRGSEVVHDDVGVLDQSMERSLALGKLQVKNDRPLVSIRS